MSFTTTSARSVRRLTAAFMAVFWLALPGALWAFDCQAIDSHGLPRDCTVLEKHGQCLVNAWDSRNQCLDGADGILQSYRCHEDYGIDFVGCNLALPFRALLR